MKILKTEYLGIIKKPYPNQNYGVKVGRIRWSRENKLHSTTR